MSSVVSTFVQSGKDLLTNVDKHFANQTPSKLIAISVLNTLILNGLYSYYKDIDTTVAQHFKRKFFDLVKKLPFLNAKIEGELKKALKNFEDDIKKSNKGIPYQLNLPPTGLTRDEVLSKVEDYIKMEDVDWKGGVLSGCVYGGDSDLTELSTVINQKFVWSNPMHADVFPDVRKMEAEVVRMVLTMFNGDDESCGTMTTGGTESIMLACKAYRDLAYSRGIKRPEMVVPITAHAAFDKASNFFKIRIHHVPIDEKTGKVNAKHIKAYINKNTCMIVGSCPNFPNGAIDPIEDLSNLAVKYNIPLHVDACLGGFLVPFMESAGFSLPLFDFRLPGVTSISCDTHKYGYTPKGSSVIMYRNVDYRKYQFFSCVEWTGGIYVSPTFAGSRAGSLIAMTWATLLYVGLDGYVNITRDVIQTTRFIADELRKIEEIDLLCEPQVSVVSFSSTKFNILNLYDDMAAKGWHLNAIQNPTGVHIAVTKLHTQQGVAQKFVDDMKMCVSDLMLRDDRQMGKMAAIYCSSQGVSDKSILADVAFMYLNACYSTKTN